MIKDALRTAFLYIADKMGLKLQDKVNKSHFGGLDLAAIGAGVIANIAIDDSDIIIEGENARAKAISNVRDYFQNEIETAAAEVALATGDCLIRPFSDGESIGLNIIGANDFVVTESIGRSLKGVIIKIDEYIVDNAVYRLFESQMLKEGEIGKVVFIRRFAFKDDSEIRLAFTQWKDIRDEENIAAQQLLLGRYKCPTLNRDNYNSVNGVPIAFGCEDIVENVCKKYSEYNDEITRKGTVIFADRSLFKNERGDDGTKRLVRDSKEYMTVKGSLSGGSLDSVIKDYSPNIREAEFKSGFELNLSVLEMCCGFSRGVFTSPETAFATATEMKNSLKKTFAFVKRFRKLIESGNEMLFGAVDIIMSLNGTTPVGDWKIRHDWSYDYVEQTTEKFNQLLQAHAAGVLKDKDLTAWVLGIDDKTAEEYIDELRQAAGAESAEQFA
nr:MAG TPA: portal protein [Caudoviricetes sp.]